MMFTYEEQRLLKSLLSFVINLEYQEIESQPGRKSAQPVIEATYQTLDTLRGALDKIKYDNVSAVF